MNQTAADFPPAHAQISHAPRIVVACSMKSGSTYVAKILSLYFDCERAYPLDYWGNREQNLFESMLRPYLDRPFVAQMHLRPHPPNIDVIRSLSMSVIYLWRNLGDVTVSFDDHVGRDDCRNPVGYIHHRHRYLALPLQHRYKYLIEHALSWYIAFYLSWRDCAEVPVVRSRYEEMVGDPYAFFSRIIAALGAEVDSQRLRALLRTKPDNTRFNRGTVGRSVTALSDANKARLEALLLSHPEDLSELWLELPWRGKADCEVQRLMLPDVESILSELVRCQHNTAAGSLLSSDPYMRIAITSEDFYFVIPGPLLIEPGASSVRLKLIVRGNVGRHFSLYWRTTDQDFSEKQVLHVDYQPSATVTAVEFNLRDITGTPVFFRLDCFNGVRSEGVCEIIAAFKLRA